MDERDQAPQSAGGHELASEVGDRVRSIISAAEDEARRIIEDAKADADAYLAERIRRISELSDTVVERAETIVSRLDRAEEVRQQLQGLADALGESAERLASEVRVGAPPPTVRSPGAAPPARDAAPAPPPPPPREGTPPPPSRGTAVPPPLREPLRAPTQPPAPSERPASPADEGEAAPSPLGETPPPFTPAAERGDLPLAGPPPTRRRSEPEPEGPAAAAEREPAAAAEAEVAEPDVVRIDRREPPAPEARPATDRREADQQLGARLVALQMAVAGGNRGEVEVHLRRTFDLADPAPILDDIFGQGTESDKRVAWPRTGDATA